MDLKLINNQVVQLLLTLPANAYVDRLAHANGEKLYTATEQGCAIQAPSEIRWRNRRPSFISMGMPVVYTNQTWKRSISNVLFKPVKCEMWINKLLLLLLPEEFEQTPALCLLENSPKKAPRWLVKNRVCITWWRHRTSARCRRSDGASKENLHFDNQS